VEVAMLLFYIPQNTIITKVAYISGRYVR